MNNKKLYEVVTDTGGVHAMTGIALVKGERHMLDPAVAGAEIFVEVGAKDFSPVLAKDFSPVLAGAGSNPPDPPFPSSSPSGEGGGDVIIEEAH